jgi:hypothetical protein
MKGLATIGQQNIKFWNDSRPPQGLSGAALRLDKASHQKSGENCYKKWNFELGIPCKDRVAELRCP